MLLTPPIAQAWLGPTAVFLTRLAFIAQNTGLCPMVWPLLALSKTPATIKNSSSLTPLCVAPPLALAFLLIFLLLLHE